VTALFSSYLSSDSSAVWHALRVGAERPKNLDPVEIAMFDLYGPIANPETTPFVVGQLGQSLDGFIATQSGASHYINGPESLIHLHRIRALCDAVVVGWKTVAADDPQLTVRHAAGNNPLRVVIDAEGRLPPQHRVFSMEPPGALRINCEGVPAATDIPEESVPAIDGRADPAAVIAALAKRGCRRILVEGGGVLVSNFLAAGVLDRLHISVAPLIIGEGRRGITVPPSIALNDALRPMSRHYSMGGDVLFDLDLRHRRG